MVRLCLCLYLVYHIRSACDTRSAKGPSVPGGHWRIFRPITYALSINTSSHHQILVALLFHSIVIFKVLIDHLIILLMLLPWPMPFDPLYINHSHISAPVQVHVQVPVVFSCVNFAHYPGSSLNCHWCISILLWSIFLFSLFCPVFKSEYQLGLISFHLLI